MIRPRLYSNFAYAQLDLYAMPLRFAQKTVDDRFRAVGYGKHTTITFRFQGYTLGGKPGYRVLGLKRTKQIFQKFFAPRVMTGKRPSLKTGMGYVAPAAARNTNFRKKLVGLLKND